MTFLQGIGYLIHAAVIAVMVWIIGSVIWATVFRGNTKDDNLMVFLWLFGMGGLIWMAGGFENVSIGFPQGAE